MSQRLSQVNTVVAISLLRFLFQNYTTLCQVDIKVNNTQSTMYVDCKTKEVQRHQPEIDATFSLQLQFPFAILLTLCKIGITK